MRHSFHAVPWLIEYTVLHVNHGIRSDHQAIGRPHPCLVSGQARAAQLASAFNREGTKRGLVGARIEFLRADVYRLKDEDAPGGLRYLAVEARRVAQAPQPTR